MINTTPPRELFCPTKLYGSLSLRARSSILTALALYHHTDDEYQAEIEISPFFKQYSFVLDPELEERIKEKGTQLIDLTPVDTALEAIARLPPAGTPIIRSWSAADTVLCISTIVGYVVTVTLAFLLHKRVNASRVFHQVHVRRPAPFLT